MQLGVFTQGATDRIDYAVDFKPWLDGDAILNATVTSESVTTSREMVGQDKVIVWVSGGIRSDKAVVTVQIDTLMGRTLAVTFIVRIL